MNKPCCSISREIIKKALKAEWTYLQGLIDSGVPSYTFSHVFDVMNSMENYCSVCGSVNPAVPGLVQQKVVAVKETEIVQPVRVNIVCPQCKGQGIKGADDNGIQIKCMTCLGQGTLNKSNTAPTPEELQRIAERTQQTDALKEKFKDAPPAN